MFASISVCIVRLTLSWSKNYPLLPVPYEGIKGAPSLNLRTGRNGVTHRICIVTAPIKGPVRSAMAATNKSWGALYAPHEYSRFLRELV